MLVCGPTSPILPRSKGCLRQGWRVYLVWIVVGCSVLFTCLLQKSREWAKKPKYNPYARDMHGSNNPKTRDEGAPKQNKCHFAQCKLCEQEGCGRQPRLIRIIPGIMYLGKVLPWRLQAGYGKGSAGYIRRNTTNAASDLRVRFETNHAEGELKI